MRNWPQQCELARRCMATPSTRPTTEVSDVILDSIDCFDDDTLRFGGGTVDASAAWTMSAQKATVALSDKWASHRNLVAGLDWWDELGETWDFWSESSVAEMAMHARNELVHHAARNRLLRDLFRASLSAESNARAAADSN